MNIDQMRYYKQQKGYSLDKLSELSGVPRGTLQKIFSGETKSPRYDTLKALEEILRPEEQIRRDAPSRPLTEDVLPGGASYGDALNPSDTAGKKNVVAESGPVYGQTQGNHTQGSYTLEDYYALPDERRVELIDGVFYDMSAPSTIHQIVGGEMYNQISNYIREKGGDCIPFIAPTDVQLDCDERTMVQPDVMILCDRSKLIRRCIMGAPDFLVEVLSPSTKRKDAMIKLNKYEAAGVREYWMVDADRERVITYFFEEDELPAIYGADAKIPVRIYGGELEISMAEIFESVRDIR